MEIMAIGKDYIKMGIMSKNVYHVRYKCLSSHVFYICESTFGLTTLVLHLRTRHPRAVTPSGLMSHGSQEPCLAYLRSMKERHRAESACRVSPLITAASFEACPSELSY